MTATPLIPTATATTAARPGLLYVDPAEVIGPISPYLFGSNYGPWSFVPLELMPLAEEAGIRFLRFPGGNWGDRNDLQPYQIDQFMALAEQLGAEPSISVRLPGGSPEDAAELVRYVNIEMEYGVRYWSIGNEPELYDDYDTQRFNEEWRQTAEAMLAVDDSILLMGPEVSQFRGNPFQDPKDEHLLFWVDEFLAANGDMVDIVTIHRYPFPQGLNANPTRLAWLRANSAEWNRIIPNLRDKIHELTGRDLPVAVTEFNSHWSGATGGEASPDSHFNAIWLADVLGRMMQGGVEIAAQFALQSSDSTAGWGLFSRLEARPSYYTYRIFRQFGDQLLLSTSGVENVSVYASRHQDGSLRILLVNLNSEAVAAPLSIEGGAEAPSQYWLFDASHPVEALDPAGAWNGQSAELPAESLSLFVFPGGD